jgi:hypothetical protein
MGRIAIACPICQGVGFNAAQDTPTPPEVVTCATCGLKLSYGFLLQKLVPVSDDRRPPQRAVRKPPMRRKVQKVKRQARRKTKRRAA